MADAGGIAVGIVVGWALLAPGSFARAAADLSPLVVVAVVVLLAWAGRRLAWKLWAYSRVLVRGRRHRTDLLRHLVLRPAVLGAVVAYESAVLVSSRVDTRLKYLATVKASSLVGCPF